VIDSLRTRRSTANSAQDDFLRDLEHASRANQPARTPAPTDAERRLLTQLTPLSGRTTAPTDNAGLSILRILCSCYRIPFRLGLAILDQECPFPGIAKGFQHPDGVMQSIASARTDTIPRVPRVLKLVLLGRSLADTTPEDRLTAAMKREFPLRLAVQLATGLQELRDGLRKFSDYVALACIAYNAGTGSASQIATAGRWSRRPTATTDAQWENLCRSGASLLHQNPQGVDVRVGRWRCDKNIPTWAHELPVYDRRTGLQLIAFQYLWAVRRCIRKRPTVPCNAELHGKRQPGSGAVVCELPKPGALDKLYNPGLIREAFKRAMDGSLSSIPDDGRPLKVNAGVDLEPVGSTP
jgi:hypothetical protein